MGSGGSPHGIRRVDDIIMPNPSPTILICTPTLHRFRGTHRVDDLKRVIEAVRNQTYTDHVHTIVRDFCADGPNCSLCKETEALIAAYARTDPRLKSVVLAEKHDSFGYYQRNLAIRQSDCPLIAYHDDDNWWEPQHLESLYKALTDANAAFAFSGSNVRNHLGKVIIHRRTRKPYFTGIDLNEILHRRELIDRYGEWNLTYDADWEMVSLWMKHGERYAATRKCTSNYALKPGLVARFWFWYSFCKHGLWRIFS